MFHRILSGKILRLPSFSQSTSRFCCHVRLRNLSDLSPAGGFQDDYHRSRNSAVSADAPHSRLPLDSFHHHSSVGHCRSTCLLYRATDMAIFANRYPFFSSGPPKLGSSMLSFPITRSAFCARKDNFLSNQMPKFLMCCETSIFILHSSKEGFLYFFLVVNSTVSVFCTVRRNAISTCRYKKVKKFCIVFS